MKARIHSIALVGWRGIDYLEIQLDDGSLTGLVGPPGAGKSTIAMCACYALLPDRRILNIAPISDVPDPHQVGVDTFAGRINPDIGYAYVLLDVRASDGHRLIAGIHVRSVDGSAEFTRLKVESPPEDWPLQDFLRVPDGDSEFYPDHVALATSLATRGVHLKECRTVREYGELLHGAGILPCDLSDTSDRALYARLIESAFRGGLTREVVSQLKEYLLPPASRIPESLQRLQKCADSMMRTRSALGTAEAQLAILESTFGLGKRIVARSLQHMDAMLADAHSRHVQADADVALHAKALSSIADSLKQIEETVTAASASKALIEGQFDIELNQCMQSQAGLRGRNVTLLQDLHKAQDVVRTFHTGRQHWMAVTQDKDIGQSIDEQGRMLEQRYRTANDKRAELEIAHRDKTQRRNALIAGASESRSAELARDLGGQSLEEALNDVSEEDARSLEMSLGGLVDGVVGPGIEALISLADDPAYPDTFWLRSAVPETAQLTQVGSWYAAAMPGGFLVTSGRRKLTLGHQARQAQIQRLEDELESLQSVTRIAVDESELAMSLRDRLMTQRTSIQVYLENRHAEAALHEAVELVKATIEEVDDALKRETERHSQIGEQRRQKTSELDSQLAGLNRQHEEATGRRAEYQQAHMQACHRKEAAATDISRGSQHVETAKQALGADFAWLMQWQVEHVLSRELYIAAQARDLTALAPVLADEPADRLEWLLAAQAADGVSCCGIWQPLREIVSERVSVETLDGDGSDLLASMAERRRELKAKLAGEQLELRSEAKSLYAVITTEIRKQERRVKALSQFGEVLKFGNVTGMRIRTEQRKDLLEKLQSATEQMDFFAEYAGVALEEQLAVLFEQSLGIKIGKRESLLDYRTYLDLYIEVQRGRWGPATGLSGGESIGAGLAIALMLAKSLAQRGSDGHFHSFTPFFIVDEVQRLNGEGQGVIVKFGQEQGMQILVTALNLEATYDCTMHTLSRIFTPAETIVSRRVKVRARSTDSGHLQRAS